MMTPTTMMMMNSVVPASRRGMETIRLGTWGPLADFNPADFSLDDFMVGQDFNQQDFDPADFA